MVLFVARMERVLGHLLATLGSTFSCGVHGEQPYQLLSETRQPKPMVPGRLAQVNYEYIREGCCAMGMLVEPLGQWKEVSVSSRRTAIDWSERVRQLVDAPRFASAERITLVCDNLNTHISAPVRRVPAGGSEAGDGSPELAVHAQTWKAG